MEMLKWSRYNFLLEIEESGKLLYNSYTNSLIKLDKCLYDELKKLEKKILITESDLNFFSKKELDVFTENKVLVRTDNDLIERLQNQSMQHIYDKSHILLTISPTLGCNFRCTYCFEDFPNVDSMSDQTENAIVEYLLKQKKNGADTLSLTWFGGEPLIEAKRISTLGSKIISMGFNIISHDVITNGYLFNEERIKLLYDIGVKEIQITIDGLKEIHDKRRVLVNGRGTFDKIIENLDNYFQSQYKNKFRIVLRVNVDKTTINNYLNVHRWLTTRYDKENIFIYPGWIHLDEDDKRKSTCLSRDELTDFNIDVYKKYQIKHEGMFPDDINIACLARSPFSKVIGPQGEIYKCMEELGKYEYVVGNINDDPEIQNFDLIAKYAIGLDHYQDTTCIECSYLPICHGGCPKRRMENKYENKQNDLCTYFKGRIEEYVELILEKE